MLLRLTLIATCILYGSFIRYVEAGQPGIVFESDIQPLLTKRCGKCHSHETRKADLDLSTIQAIRRGGESGESLVGPSLDDSLLWTLIESGEMPPEDEPKLTEQELDSIRNWITSGARSKMPAQSDGPILTQHSVLPIVLLRCTTCHGARLKEGGLDLRTVAGMLEGGEHGPALVTGDADRSQMIQRIETESCPPSKKLLKFFVRRPPKSEVKILRDWIEAGAPQVDTAPDLATTTSDPLVTDDDRQHWSFRPLRTAPAGKSVDHFIGRKLNDVGLELTAQAARETLIRRVYIDLIGMPPGPEELQRLRTSGDPLWYRNMVEVLLASPQYGERWGRYWLDLAGYADSEGGVATDPVRPVAWRYRDYVIDAFNTDKPYDQFLIEQLAGDELLDYEQATEVSEQMVQNLIATGFLRMGIDETGSRTMNFVPERLKVISDAIHVVSSGLMGLTMECARCHSHKYDPIPHRDYYRFKAIFQGALDEHDWDSFKTRTVKLGTPAQRKDVKQINPPLEKQIKELTATRKNRVASLQLELLQHHYPEQSDRDNQQTLAALKVADNTRTLSQRTLVHRLQRSKLLPDSKQSETVLGLRSEIKNLDRRIDRLRRRQATPLAIRALWDLGRPSPTYILRRGEHDRPGDAVGPGVPSVLTDGRTPFVAEPPFPGGTSKTGRRLAFAQWLTQPDHPTTARVMVNRIWYHHFGQGLVKELNNFGVQSEPPSHPELLDWLAGEFVRCGWSIKQIHRLILNSRTYQQPSQASDQRYERDPDNRLLSRMNLRRLDAEALRDSLLMIADKLDNTSGGIPDTVSVDRNGLVSVNPTDGGGWRRSVYLQFRRTEIPTLMDTFDYPPMGPNCSMRNVSNISPQALMLMNNDHVRQLAASFANRVRQMAFLHQSADSHLAQVECAYQIALCRPPNMEERRVGVQALRELESAWGESSDQALVTFCHTLLNSAAFLYVD